MDLLYYLHPLFLEGLNASINFNEIIATYGYIGFFIVSFIATLTVILPLPYLILIYIAGSTQQFNPALIGLSSGLGAALGEIWVYFVGRGGRKLLPETFRERADKLRKLIESYGVFMVVFIFAATPLPDDPIYLILGVLKVDLKKIFLAAFLGKTLLSAFVAYAGYYSYEAILDYMGKEMSVWASLLLFIFALVLTYVILKIDWDKYIK